MIDYSEILEDEFAKYESAIFRIAEDCYSNVVEPFCKKRGYRFISGNGNFLFVHVGTGIVYSSSSDSKEEVYEDKELYEIVCVLSEYIEGIPYNNFGSLMGR